MGVQIPPGAPLESTLQPCFCPLYSDHQSENEVEIITKMIATEKKSEVTKQFQVHSRDTGSADVQIALLTARINELSKHLEGHVKDHSSRRGLLKLVGQRRRLLDYLSRANAQRYQELIKKLNLRK